MADNINTLVYSFESEIGKDGDLHIPTNTLRKIREKGYKKIKVSIYGSSLLASKHLGFSEETFNKIKNVQSLPDTVVLDFLSVKGSISEKSFASRVLKYNE